MELITILCFPHVIEGVLIGGNTEEQGNKYNYEHAL